MARDSDRLTQPSLLAVFAHPDDESLACGGTLARLADLGWNVTLVCASKGERGGVIEPSPTFDGDVGRVRLQELHAASGLLGVRTVHVLSFPDGNLRWAGGAQLCDEISELVRRYRPDAVITFDDDGLYWHADHVAVHEETSRALGALGDCAPALYYVTMAPGAMRSVVRSASERRWIQPTAGVWSLDPSAFGVAANAPSFAIDVGPWLVRKLAALQCHRSQFGSVNPFSLLSPSEAQDWLGFEYFRRAPMASSHAVVERFAVQSIHAH